MKKSIIGFIFGVILTLSVGSYAMTAINSAQYNDTKIQLDGEVLTLNDQCVTVVNEGTEWGFNTVPIRAFFESINYSVDWDSTSNTILLESPLTDLETVAKNCKNSAVMIYSYKGDAASQGSGVVVSGSYILTAKHVVDGANKIDIFTDDSKYGVSGTIYYVDPTLDVAILKATTGQKTVTLGDSDKLIEGEKLVSITSPQGAMNVIEECTFAGKLETETQSSLNISDTSITGGSSGGAIFNYDSEIIGMATNGENNVTEAIPINRMKSVLSNIK